MMAQGLRRIENARGFSLIELITVMLVIGVLAVVAVPRFSERITFDTRGFADQIGAALRFAQKSAVAARRVVCVDIAAGSLTLTRSSAVPPDATCGDALDMPGGSGNVLNAPTGVSLSAATFNFDALGRPSAGAVAVTVTGDSSLTITIEAETGHVH